MWTVAGIIVSSLLAHRYKGVTFDGRAILSAVPRITAKASVYAVVLTLGDWTYDALVAFRVL